MDIETIIVNLAPLWLVIIVGVGLIYLLLAPKSQNNKKTLDINTNKIENEAKESIHIQGSYQRAWLFSYNEKDAYRKLKPIAEDLGYTVFAKVRLLDLVEPVKGIQKYKTYFYKVQAKHVDFVLCDTKLVARYIIELDDISHNTEKRKVRDEFVDEVVQSVGYQIIHVRAIDESIRQKIKQRT